jgi:hypothetical protein
MASTEKPNLREYGELTEFLRKTVANPKATVKLRMQAATRLDDLFARHEMLEEKAAARAERRELRALGLNAPIPRKKGEETTVEETVAQTPSPEELRRNLERLEIDRVLNRA